MGSDRLIHGAEQAVKNRQLLVKADMLGLTLEINPEQTVFEITVTGKPHMAYRATSYQECKVFLAGYEFARWA